MTESATRTAYAAAGVDVRAGERAVELLRERGAIAGGDLLGRLGGFGAALAIPPGYREPVLVSATDGVGTKLEIARRMGRYDTVGRDLVAMCADDVVCHGARPFFFLDYIAVGRLVPERIAELVAGVTDGCDEAGCALVGGETAEHPGVMEPDAFDMAGFCVGIVERGALLDGSTVRAGDAVVGIASSGLHANGYSLVRSLMARHGLDVATPFREVTSRFHIADDGASGETLGDVLLTPTRIYARHVLNLREDVNERGLRLGGISHITGGGLAGNLPRAVPDDLAIQVDPNSWRLPSIFRLLQVLGDLPGPELRATLNSGIGMAIVVEPGAVDFSIERLGERGLPAWQIGRVVPADGGPRYLEGVR